MRLTACLAPFALALALPCCGGSVANPGGGGPGTPGTDGGTTNADGGAPGTVVGDCGPGASCPTGSTCYFPIGSCDATGECVANPAPGTPECGAIEILCGCGQNAYSGCGYPEGFASAPTNGDTTTCEGTRPPPPLDAGPAPDATPPADGGGPCVSDDDCNPGYGCYYAIGSCPGQGECVANPTGPGCGAEEILCGCDGSQVTSGCGFPGGYASGPTDGSGECDTFDAGPAPDASAPDSGDDAGDACGALADCCPEVPATSQAGCKSVVESDNEATCASELSAYQAEGFCD